ncbi:hypothetical protein KEM52_003718 [Ascosphaera acerosa]|nr:hypothetical protein KEM52_003718 [Ascosphaera acerosa]
MSDGSGSTSTAPPPGTGSGQKPIDEFVSLIQNPFKSAFQVNAVWLSFGVSIGVTVAIAFLFSLFRTRSSVIYAPKIRHADRKHQPPPIDRGFFGWWKPVVMTKEQDVIDQLGLDATIFLRFARMCRNLFFVLAVLGCTIMIPVNMKESDTAIAPEGMSAFTLMTPMYVFNRSLWSHVIIAWAFDAIVCGYLWWTYRAVVRLRKHYFASSEYQSSLHARTVLVRHIPPQYRTDEGLLRITDEVNPTTSIPRAAIGRNVKELPELFEEHEAAVKMLEDVLAKYFKDPDRLPPKRPRVVPDKRFYSDYPAIGRDLWGRPQVDAIDYLTSRIKHLEVEIKLVRQSIDKRNAMGYGFASFGAIESAHILAHAAKGKRPFDTTIYLAPRPNDLIWENLDLTRGKLRRKRILNVIWGIGLTVLYIGPNALIAIFLTDLSNLGQVWKPFQNQLDSHQKLWAAVQGIASPAITSLVYLVLPSIFRRLATKAGDITKTSREQHVIGRLYAFFVFNNLFVFSVFSAVSAFVMSVVTTARDKDVPVAEAMRQGHFFVKVMTTLCQISPFWVTYIFQRNMGAAIDLIQMVQLVWKWFRRRFMHPTPRDAIEWTAPPPFPYAMYYNYFLFYSTIALSFATLQPIVLPATALYFCIDVYMKKYLLLYVFVTKTESGGMLWKPVFNRCVFACLFANVVTALVVKARGSWTMIFALCPLPVVLLLFKLYCRRVFDDDLVYVARKDNSVKIMEVEGSSGAASDKTGHERLRQLSKRYGHPVFYKQFMTPMVHAKAADALEAILEARRDGGDGGVTGFADTVDGYSDIALRDLDPADGVGDMKGALREGDKDGKRYKLSARKSVKAAGFEVVPESELDFAYFKERPEFREQHGGEGGMYGGFEDSIDRAATPSVFPASGRATPVPGAPSRSGTFGLDDGSDGLPPRLFGRTATGLSAASSQQPFTRAATPGDPNPYAQAHDPRLALGAGRAVQQQGQGYRGLQNMAPTLPDIGMLERNTPSPGPGPGRGLGPGPLGTRHPPGSSSEYSVNSSAGLLQQHVQDEYAPADRGPSPTRHLLAHTGDRSEPRGSQEYEYDSMGGAHGVPVTAASPLAESFEERRQPTVAEFQQPYRGRPGGGNLGGGDYRGYRY